MRIIHKHTHTPTHTHTSTTTITHTAISTHTTITTNARGKAQRSRIRYILSVNVSNTGMQTDGWIHIELSIIMQNCYYA